MLLSHLWPDLLAQAFARCCADAQRELSQWPMQGSANFWHKGTPAMRTQPESAKTKGCLPRLSVTKLLLQFWPSLRHDKHVMDSSRTPLVSLSRHMTCHENAVHVTRKPFTAGSIMGNTCTVLCVVAPCMYMVVFTAATMLSVLAQ